MLRTFFSAVTRLSLRFYWITIATAVILIGLGVYAALQMNQELLPPLEFPETFVFTVQPGASSEDLRDLVTIPLEKEFTALQSDGVIPDGLESTTVSPVSVITVRYEYGINPDNLRAKMQKVIDK